MDKPVVLFSNCLTTSNVFDNIVQPLIIDKSFNTLITENNSTLVLEDMLNYDWKIDTKYYTADVVVTICNAPTIGNEQFANCVECIGLFFDPNNLDSYNLVNSWLSYITHLTPSVLFLICNQVTSLSKVSKEKVLHFCIKNNFELIELNPEDEIEEDSYSDFQDSYGVTRIKQALFAHTWGNLVLKNKPHIRSDYMENLMQKEKKNNMLTEKKNSNLLEVQLSDGLDNVNCNLNTESIDKEIFFNPSITKSSSCASNFENKLENHTISENLIASENIILNGNTNISNSNILESLDQDISTTQESDNIFEQMHHFMAEASKYDVGSEKRRDIATDAMLLLCKNLDLSCDELDSDSS